MKFLIAGFGSIGRRHFRNLKALGEDDFVFYRSRRSTLPDEEIAAYPVEMDLKAALAHQPDAVIVANPTALHLEVAIPAASQGCHLFIEKPVAHNLERVDELAAAAARGGGKILVGFQFRFHPGLHLIKQLLALTMGPAGSDRPSGEGASLAPQPPEHFNRPSGEGASLVTQLHERSNRPSGGNHPNTMDNQTSVIGRLLAFRVHWGEYLPGWHPWEDYRQGYAARPDLGGGVVLTLSHPLDYLRWLFGDVAALWAFAGHLSDLELAVEDTAEIGLKFDSGVVGSVHLNYLQRPPQHTLEIVGTEGTIRWDNANGAVQIYSLTPGGEGGKWETHSVPEGFERNGMFLDQTRHFLAVARGEAEPVCTLNDGVQALRLALGALESAGSGKLVKL